MRRSFAPFLATGLVTFVAACTDGPTQSAALRAPAASLVTQPPITVMSRNLYLGADIDAVIAPGADLSVVLPQAIAQLQRTNYPARVQYIAAEIAQRQPHAVGLQEATTYTFYLQDGSTQVLDFVEVLQLYLEAMGVPYDVAIRQNDLSLTLPVFANGIAYVNYTDGDAILVRHDVARSNAVAQHFANQQLISIPGMGSVPNLRGWNAVTLNVNGTSFRFVNTHLEIQAFRAMQEQQAQELVALFQNETLPVVMVGDFNSAANSWAPDRARTQSYRILRSAGYSDLELRQPGSEAMATCCHAADLSDEVTNFKERLDLVLARTGATGFGGQSSIEIVTGTRFLDQTSGFYLWPSDHAAVFAQLWLAPGEVAQQ